MILRILLVLLFVGAVSFYLLFSPTYFSSATFNGRPIKIQRNAYGIPTIHVSSIDQFLFGLGTVQAEDRLFQMTFRSYTVQGRLSEFLGEKPLPYDRYMREVNLKGWADKRADRLKNENPQRYNSVSIMAQAINERVAAMRILPLQFYLTGMSWQNFTVNHLFYLSIVMEWAISMNVVDEYTRSILLANHTVQQIDWILPNKKEFWAFQSIPIVSDDEIPHQLRTQNVRQHLEKIKFDPLSVERPIALDIIEYQSTVDATNTWAVSGKHTQTGLPVLVNDPHLESILPSQWYQLIINYTLPNGQSWVSSGQTVVGIPTVFGRNPYFATGKSVSHGDNQDLFREKVQNNKYLLDGVWRDLKIRKEVIKVKSSSGVKEEIYEVRQTHRGPIVHYIFSALGSFKIENDDLSLAWTGFNSEYVSVSEMIDSFLIDNFDDLRNYLQNHTKTFLNLNIMAVTADNHILMQQSGLQPIRHNSDSGNFIKDGTTTDHDWVGVLRPQDRMHLYDPPKGYIVHANNRVAEGGYFGGYLNYTTFTARADRIDELIKGEIAAGRKIGKQFMKKVLYDTVDVYCRQILPELIAVVQEARPILGNFNCNFSSKSYAASFYQVFMWQLHHLTKPVHLQKMSLITFNYMQQGIFNYIHFAFKGDTKRQEIMRAAWLKAVAHLKKHFETEEYTKWEWGKFHRDANNHMLFRTFPVLDRVYHRSSQGWGNMHTPNIGKMQKLEFGDFSTTHHANIRVLYGYGKDYVNEWGIDGGASQNILSSHYSDQLTLMQQNKLIRVFGEKDQNQEL